MKRKSNKERNEITDQKLSAWSEQPYGVGFQEVRVMSAELLKFRQKEELVQKLVDAIDQYHCCGAIQEAREALQ